MGDILDFFMKACREKGCTTHLRMNLYLNLPIKHHSFIDKIENSSKNCDLPDTSISHRIQT